LALSSLPHELISQLTFLLLSFELLAAIYTEGIQSHLTFLDYQVEMPVAGFSILQSVAAIQQCWPLAVLRFLLLMKSLLHTFQIVKW